MISGSYWDELSFFIDKIENEKVNWALTGSYRLFLEDERMIQPKDIDILTDKEGAKSIQKLFAEYIAKPFGYSASGCIKSYFGQLKIGDIDFDIMSEVFNEVNGEWIGIPNLESVEYTIRYGKRIPILPLETEKKVSEILNHKEKLNVINKIIENRESAKNKNG